jgi:hypothetical protein
LSLPKEGLRCHGSQFDKACPEPVEGLTVMAHHDIFEQPEE